MQEAVFKQNEADNWFERNAVAIAQKQSDLPFDFIQEAGIGFSSVLEIGCSNGYRLQLIRKVYPRVNAVGVEPSLKAIEDGKNQYPGITFIQSTASDLSKLGDQKFDLVILNFVFHWISRDTLAKSVAEIDRVIADNGFLLIGDFAPSLPMKVPYHHRTDVQLYTYKQDYAGIFTSLGFYKEVKKDRFNHSNPAQKVNIPDQDACSLVLLQKNLSLI